jgi:hypothetical protein
MFQCACLWLQNPIRQSCFEQQRHHRCLFWGDHLSVPSTLLLLLPGSSQSTPYCGTVPFLLPKIWPADMMLWNLSQKKTDPDAGLSANNGLISRLEQGQRVLAWFQLYKRNASSLLRWTLIEPSASTPLYSWS